MVPGDPPRPHAVPACAAPPAAKHQTAEERLTHVSAILEAIRRVNHLIVRERDPARLTQGACESLIGVCGYRVACIVLIDEHGAAWHHAAAGTAGAREAVARVLQSGTLLPCAPHVLATDGVLKVDRERICCGCPVVPCDTDGRSLAIRLELDGTLYGFMSVSTADEHIDETEEVALFAAVAADVALALHHRSTERDRWRAVEALRRSESSLAEAQRIAHLGNWDLDLRTDSLFWSDEIHRIFGLHPGDFRATYEAFLERVHPDDRERVVAAVDAAIKTNASYDIVHRIVQPSGAERVVREQAEVHRSSDGVATRMIGTVLDITDQKQAEAELEQYREHLEELVARRTTELQQANGELETFVYTVSHDLRAPLRGINTLTEIILDDFAESVPDALREYLDRLSGAVGRMNRMVDALLDLSRVNRAELHIEPIDLTAEAHHVLDELAHGDPQREVVRDVAPAMSVEADPVLLRVVLDNLLGNAWKFTSRNRVAHITVGQRTVDGETTFFVSDDGTGFASDRATRLFRPFQRLHHQRDFPGTGIGLATVARVIHRHRGRVWAEAAEGAGATFYFTAGATGG